MFSSTRPQDSARIFLEREPYMGVVVIAALVMRQDELARLLPMLFQLQDRPQPQLAVPANDPRQPRLFNEINRFNQQRQADQEPTHTQRSQQKNISHRR